MTGLRGGNIVNVGEIEKEPNLRGCKSSPRKIEHNSMLIGLVNVVEAQPVFVRSRYVKENG